LKETANNTSVAKLLFDEVKILCLVLTHPAAHRTKAKAVKETWGRRCSKLLFFSTELGEWSKGVVIFLKQHHTGIPRNWFSQQLMSDGCNF
jgi:hypothetical protein